MGRRPARLNNGARSKNFGPRQRKGGLGKPPLHYLCSVPVWPSGDWLPLSYFERAKQVGGQFGLAIDYFPRSRLAEPPICGVKKLAGQAEPSTTGTSAVHRIATDR